MKVSNRRRLISQLIDLAITLIAGILMYLYIPFVDEKFYFLGFFEELVLSGTIFGFLYYLFFYLVFSGVTIGRLFTNSRVVKNDGTKMGLGAIIVRALMQCCYPLLLLNVFYQLIYKSKESLFAKTTNTTAIPIKIKQ